MQVCEYFADAVLGTSTVTTFVESASGVSSGGRTGLTALTAAVLFLLSTLFAPLFTAIPSFATAPALIMVGFLMVSSVTEIRFDDDNLGEAIPAYIAIIAMPLFYSISEGIISYVVLPLVLLKGISKNPPEIPLRSGSFLSKSRNCTFCCRTPVSSPQSRGHLL